MVGKPYKYGGASPSGFDCSGFVRYVFGLQQIEMPRTVAEQFGVGRRVSIGDVRAGDLVFFTTTGPGATHVGIVLGDRLQPEFVHAPSDGAAVRIDRYDAPYWRQRIVGARRIF